jgi:hypothetical protein
MCAFVSARLHVAHRQGAHRYALDASVYKADRLREDARMHGNRISQARRRKQAAGCRLAVEWTPKCWMRKQDCLYFWCLLAVCRRMSCRAPAGLHTPFH